MAGKSWLRRRERSLLETPAIIIIALLLVSTAKTPNAKPHSLHVDGGLSTNHSSYLHETSPIIQHTGVGPLLFSFHAANFLRSWNHFFLKPIVIMMTHIDLEMI